MSTNLETEVRGKVSPYMLPNEDITIRMVEGLILAVFVRGSEHSQICQTWGI